MASGSCASRGCGSQTSCVATAGTDAVGEARRSRIADVPVLAISVRAGETLLVVDRVCLPHLFAWIRETLLDFETG